MFTYTATDLFSNEDSVVSAEVGDVDLLWVGGGALLSAAGLYICTSEKRQQQREERDGSCGLFSSSNAVTSQWPQLGIKVICLC